MLRKGSVSTSHQTSAHYRSSVLTEVGTGDYFGPMTVVAAYVQKEQLPLLKN